MNLMSKHKFLLLLILILLAVLAGGCRKETKTPDRVSVAFTSIVPHQYVVERIAGARFSVQAMVGPGQSAHSFTPTPAQMAALSQASLFFFTGVEFEAGLLPKIRKGYPNITLVDLRQGLTLRDIDGGSVHQHDSHTGVGDQEYQWRNSKDPHIWLSPVQVKVQAQTIKQALVKADPQGNSLYHTNLRAFLTELDDLNTHLHKVLSPYKGSDFFVFHPAFGYFADEYGLRQRAVEVEGKEPGARDLARLIDEIRALKVSVIFTQPQYTNKSVRIVAAQAGCMVVPINPMPQDYFKDMMQLGAMVSTGLAR